MIRYNIKLHIIIIILLTTGSFVSGQEFGVSGLSSAWVTASHNQAWTGQIGGRYIPELDFLIPVKSKYSFEGEFSVNATGAYTHPLEGDNWYGKIKPYRMWVKFSGEQFEIRAGLQKINFGPGTMLRSLMWFDRIDPRDPLQLTDGVYGLLGRYYFMNNANIWIWGLYGNEGTKGWELLPTEASRPEFGGRIQLPLQRGELAFTYHNRSVELDTALTQDLVLKYFNENRFAIDFKLDLGVGLWGEAVYIYQDQDYIDPYRTMITIGSDYTFNLGNGLNLIAEHLYFGTSDEFFGKYNGVSLTGLSLNYPLSVISNINVILYYDWVNNDFYRFINLGLSFDRFSYYFMGFWNPDNFRIYNFEGGPNLYNGAGFQLMIVFNH